MSELERQTALLQSLISGAPTEGLAAATHGVARGLQAYRVNAQAVAARALAAVYVPLQDELGEAQFAAMAWAFWRRHPPERGDLACWGAGLPDFMAEQAKLPRSLIELARLQWALHEAERAADAALDTDSLQLLDGRHDAALLSLRLMPGLSLVSAGTDVIAVWRNGWRAVSAPLAEDWAFFMAALLNGQALGPALEASLARHPSFDFSAWLQRALREPWLQSAGVIR